MAIRKIIEDGNELFNVYVNIRSKTHKNRRIQKYSYRLKTLNDARREEKRLIREASFEIQETDGFGHSWSDVVHLWYQEVKAGHLCKVSDQTAKTYISILNKWTSSWDNIPAGKITVSDGREVIKLMDRQNLTKRYQRKVKNIINNVYEWGIEYRYIFGNDRPPLKGLLIETISDSVPDIMTFEEIKRFLSLAKALDHYWYPIWSFAILTGMRSGELHALSWEQIDLEKNTIRVDRSFDSNLKQVGPTKARYWRSVPINSNLRKLILDLSKKRDGEDEFVLPRSKTWDNGDQAVPLKDFLRSIKMKPIKFHALRACFATQMLASGVPAPVVMKIGGWKKTDTMDIYLRLAGVQTKDATKCLEFDPDELSFSFDTNDLFQ